MATELLHDPAACHHALRTRDARFDGRFFVGVTSTRIYCRPVCRVRTPRPDHCRYFGLAAQAEQAGFRPCLRCRPELAPADRHWSLHDAAERLIGHALQWLDDPAHGFTDDGGVRPLSQLARHLGVTERHLRRLFAARLGMSPLQYLQTRRLLTAKLLLTDTPLPVGQVALISGFGSLRRFNDVFVQAYGMSPSKLRQPARSTLAPQSTMRPARLAWRPPMNVQALLGFLGQRLLSGNEQLITGSQPGILKAVALQHHGVAHAGWIRVRFSPDQACVLLDVGPSLLPLLPQVIWRVRHWLDLDTDTAVIDALLEPDFTGGSGMRVPGSFDGFETGVRAILGQQVSLGTANALVARLTDRLGEPIVTPDPSVSRLFPAPARLAGIDPAVLGELGIVRQRQAALQALARAVLDGQLDLSAHADADRATQALLALPGIGPWTAQYIAMRALRWPDAWPVGDVALTRAMGLPQHLGAPAQREAQRLSGAWRPWRSYAVMRIWAGLHAGANTTKD